MRQHPYLLRWQIPLASLSVALLLLSACSTAPEQSTPGASVMVPTDEPPEESLGASLELPPSEHSALFEAAERQLLQFNWMGASELLSTLDAGQLQTNDSVYYGYLQARIAYARGMQRETLDILKTLDRPGIDTALLYRVRNLKRHATGLGGDYLESARLGDLLLRAAPNSDMAPLKRDIWLNLERVSPDLLQAAMPGADPQWLGWLQLASLSRSGTASSYRQLGYWRDGHAEHPAANPLPGGLEYLQTPGEQADKIALLLPLSGRLAAAGKAVRDGYLASYYAARAQGATQQEVLILDSDGYDTIETAYYEALLENVNLVIGPLSKQGVTSLGKLNDRPVPLLALNRTDQPPATHGSPMVQLSLAPEDEAQRIAQLAFGRGARRAMVIRPAGAWGDKMEKALRKEWQRLGGNIASGTSYQNQADYSRDVKAGLGLPASEQRAREIGDFLEVSTELTPRRRQDLDAVFLLSRNGAEARSLKPLLAFHYAGDLPVYAPSTVYSGSPDERDRDLNGINLVETPWLLGFNPGARVAIAAGDTGTDNYTRLNALGADAFLLQQNFSRFQAGADALVRGNTGLLTMDPQLRIHRELSLATFDGGELKPQ